MSFNEVLLPSFDVLMTACCSVCVPSVVQSVGSGDSNAIPVPQLSCLNIGYGVWLSDQDEDRTGGNCRCCS